MPCKYFRNSLAVSILIASSLVAQPLDWHTDVVCFGTDQHEWAPQIISLPGGALRSFCLRDQSHLSARMSLTGGETWDTFHDVVATGDSTRMVAESDADFSYVISWRRGGHTIVLHKMPLFSSEWPESPLSLDLPDSLLLMAADLTTDAAIWPDDTFLYLCWLARSPSGGVLGFARSESRGDDWTFSTMVAQGIPLSDSTSVISMAVSWTTEWLQSLTIATERDRPGSIGEEIVLYHSDDYGLTWDTGRAVDPSAYPQQQPTLTARGDTVLLAYARRNSAAITRDVFYTFTLEDGGEWTEPVALAATIADEHLPKLLNSPESGLFSLCYLQGGVQVETGSLRARVAQISEPWTWSEESDVSDGQTVYVREGWDACAHEDGFAAVWTSRFVGDDGDVMFDASWRNVSVGPNPSSVADQLEIYPNPTPGNLTIAGGATKSEVLLYDLLGRRVAAYEVSGVRNLSLPLNLPQGTYYLRAEGKPDVHRVMLIR